MPSEYANFAINHHCPSPPDESQLRGPAILFRCFITQAMLAPVSMDSVPYRRLKKARRNYYAARVWNTFPVRRLASWKRNLIKHARDLFTRLRPTFSPAIRLEGPECFQRRFELRGKVLMGNLDGNDVFLGELCAGAFAGFWKVFVDAWGLMGEWGWGFFGVMVLGLNFCLIDHHLLMKIVHVITLHNTTCETIYTDNTTKHTERKFCGVCMKFYCF